MNGATTSSGGFSRRLLSAYLRILRLPNLGIVALTLFLLRWQLLLPLCRFTGAVPTLGTAQFALLVASTLCTAAAGYVINDYYDHGIDLHNKPQKTFISSAALSRAEARRYYLFISAFGALLAAILAHQQQAYHWLPLYPVATLLLWAYSRWFKKMFFIGNFTVAAFTAAVALLPLLPEIGQLKNIQILDYQIFIKPFYDYAIFAFLTNLYREIIKDCEDIEGDQQANCRTIPIVLGTRLANVIATIPLFALTFFFIFSANYQFGIEKKYTTVAYLFLLILLPTFGLIAFTARAKTKSDYKSLSFYTKLLMLAGLIFLFFL